VTSVLALFVALGGVSYAAATINGANITNRSIAAKKIKKHTLTGTEINVSRLGTVPNASSLGGLDAGRYETKAEAAAGFRPAPFTNATLEPGWTSNGDNTVAFYKDQLGVVHLKGSAFNGTGASVAATILTLPAGYRPSVAKQFAVACGSNLVQAAGIVGIVPQGGLQIANGTCATTPAVVNLDGITFRTDG
jgi:hypothetical protein